MQDTDFYRVILGLDNDWQVSKVDLNVERNVVEVHVEPTDQLRCSECGKRCPVYDHGRSRRWRHLDTCQMRTVLVARVPRTECAEHGVKTASVPWAEKGSRFTALFEQVAILWLQVARSQTGVAKLLGLSFDQVHGIMTRAVERGLARRSEEPIRYLGIDEKSMKKGHNYLTVVSDLTTGRVLEVAESRTQESAESALRDAVPEQHRSTVDAVCTDMWTAFMNAAQAVLPEAKLVHDKFHVAKHLNDAVDKTRREEQRKLLKEGDDRVKRARYFFLSNFTELDDEATNRRFREAREAAETTTKVWESKEVFRPFWEQETVELARHYLNSWCKAAKEKGVAALTTVADMLASHEAGLVNYVLHPITNSIAENLNGKIQLLKATARGFRAFENYRTNILFYHGKLDLSPHKIR